MSVETKVKLESRCKCQRFSCESAVKKISEGVYEYDLERRFQYIKDKEGAICGGDYVEGCIARCQIKIDRDNGIVNPADVPVAREKANKSSETSKNKKKKKRTKARV